MSTTAKIWFAQFVDDEGVPVAGVKVYHYEAGTTTDKDVYADQGKTTTLSQPVGGDSTGFVKFFGDGTYRLRIVSNEDILLYDLDAVEITGSNQGTSSRILFYGSSGAITDDDDLTWDSTNKRLAVGTTTNITEQLTMGPGGFLGAERTGAGSNEGAKRLIGLNSNNKVSIDPMGMGTVLSNLPAKGLLYLDENGQIQVLTLTNGQFLIGSNGVVPIASTLQAGDGITITEGPGTASIATSAVQVLDRQALSLDVADTVVETTVYTVVIPAGKLTGNKAAHVCLMGHYLNASGATKTLQLKIKNNGVTVFDDTTGTFASSAAYHTWRIEFDCANRDSIAVAAWFNGSFRVGAVDAAATGDGAIDAVDVVSSVFGAGVSWNAALTNTITVTITHSAAHADTLFGITYGSTIIR